MPIDLSPLAGRTLEKPMPWGSLASLLREDCLRSGEFPRGPGVSGALGAGREAAAFLKDLHRLGWNRNG